MNQWKSMSEFPWPTEEFDLFGPNYLFYSPKTGIVIGSCYMTDDEYYGKEYSFRYDRDGLIVQPTHWMELPDRPK
jgi:hypothetical protein